MVSVFPKLEITDYSQDYPPSPVPSVVEFALDNCSLLLCSNINIVAKKQEQCLCAFFYLFIAEFE